MEFLWIYSFLGFSDSKATVSDPSRVLLWSFLLLERDAHFEGERERSRSCSFFRANHKWVELGKNHQWPTTCPFAFHFRFSLTSKLHQHHLSPFPSYGNRVAHFRWNKTREVTALKYSSWLFAPDYVKLLTRLRLHPEKMKRLSNMNKQQPHILHL